MNQTDASVVYEWVRRIPKGRVATYGTIARLARVKTPRIVGWYLHRNPDPMTIPCHRVVNGKGELAMHFAFGGAQGQRKLLEAETVSIRHNRVDLAQFGWNPA